MPALPAFLLRPHAGYLIVLGSGALGSAYSYKTLASDADHGSELNPHTFTPYTLAAKTPVSSTNAVFTLRARAGDGAHEALKELRGKVWSVQVKQPQLQIARAYTPLPAFAASAGAPSTASTSKSGAEHGEDQGSEIRLLVRREHGGELSSYIHGLPLQSTVELRGPNVEAEIPQHVEEVVFLAGGTGIAPALQVADALAGRRRGRMCVLWANRKREDCVGGVSDGEEVGAAGRGWGWGGWFGRGRKMVREEVGRATGGGEKGLVVQELEALKRRAQHGESRLSVEYFVDEENSFVRPANVAKHLKLSTEKDKPAHKGSKILFVSGPEGFIDYWAGRKVWVGGRETQGPLGGVLSQMDLRGWTVFKL